MKPLLLAGHPALEFLNTAMTPRGQPVDLISDGRALLRWLCDAGVVDAAARSRVERRFDAAALDDLAAEARKLRTWAAAWIARWRTDPGARYEPELRRLNELLAHASDHRQLVRDAGQLTTIERHRSDTPEQLLAILAAALADLVAEEQPALVKRCEGAQCTLWFVDRTKAHRRRFCSVAACGNRDKVAAFRERQRQRRGP